MITVEESNNDKIIIIKMDGVTIGSVELNLNTDIKGLTSEKWCNIVRMFFNNLG